MFEVTREMMEQAIDEEKERNQASTKAVTNTAFVIIAVLGIEILVLFSLLSDIGIKMLAVLPAVIIADLLLFAAVVLLLSAKYTPNFSVKEFWYAFRNQRFNKEYMSADVGRKIEMYEARLASAKNDDVKINAVNALINLYILENLEEKIEEAAEILDGLTPVSLLSRYAKLTALLMYYDYKDDADSYVSAYENGMEILEKSWTSHMFMKISVASHCSAYYMMNKDYRKALDAYNLYLEFSDRASKIDASHALPSESKDVICLDYAMCYCKLGENEKAAESFRVALERFENTDVPSLKKYLEKVRRMLDEAGIDYT